MKRSPHRRRTRLLAYLVLTLLALFAVGPLLTLFFNSFKDTAEIARNPLAPPAWELLRWQNYPEAWQQGNYTNSFVNSVIITTGTVAGVALIAGLAAYALARLKPPGSDALTLYFLVGTALPAQLFMVPLFFLWTRLGLINNFLGIIIIYWAIFSPFATFLLRSFMVAIPGDFEDAARVDGANEWQVFRHVMLPITWPGFLTACLITGLGAWNEFLFAVTFLQKPELKPVSTGLYSFTSRFATEWGLTSAASVMVMLPVIVLFLLLQRRFIAGLTQGGLKA
jgi:raffinose/stachyose/melibiose transport system permease protein